MEKLDQDQRQHRRWFKGAVCRILEFNKLAWYNDCKQKTHVQCLLTIRGHKISSSWWKRFVTLFMTSTVIMCLYLTISKKKSLYILFPSGFFPVKQNMTCAYVENLIQPIISWLHSFSHYTVAFVFMWFIEGKIHISAAHHTTSTAAMSACHHTLPVCGGCRLAAWASVGHFTLFCLGMILTLFDDTERIYALFWLVVCG